jgi:hypothetical protein
MTNITRMTNTEAQLREAVETSNAYFMDQNWALAEAWGLRAEELQRRFDLERMPPELEPCGA